MDIASHFDAVKASFLLNQMVGSFVVKEEEIRNEDGVVHIGVESHVEPTGKLDTRTILDLIAKRIRRGLSPN